MARAADRRHRWRPVALLLAISMLGCQRAGSGDAAFSVRWTLTPDPPRVGPATFSLTLTDSTTGRPASGARVQLEGNMTHPGMQPVFSAAREIAPGRYEAPLALSMGGDWFVLIDATFPDGRRLHRQVSVPGVRER